MRRAVMSGVLVIACVAWPRRASALDDVRLGATQRLGVVASVGATSAPRTSELSAQQLAPTLGATLRLSRSWLLTAEWGTATTWSRIANRPREVVTRSSNVLVGARWVYESERLRASVGASIGAPLVTVPGGGIGASAAAEQADRVALGATGPEGTWRWGRNAIPAFVSLRGTRVAGPLALSLDLQPGVLLSVNRNVSRAVLVVRGELALAESVVAPYVALSTAVLGTPIDGRDHSQTGVAVGVRYSSAWLFGWSEARMQLDGPDGVADPYATFWGATLGIGAAL